VTLKVDAACAVAGDSASVAANASSPARLAPPMSTGNTLAMGMGKHVAIVFAAAAALLLTPVGEAGAASSAGPVRGSVVISNERSVTWWGTPAELSFARVRPDIRAPAITRLHWNTEDGYPEVYVVLRRWRSPRRGLWLLVRLPMRPNGRKGWVPENALAPLHRVTTQLVIDRGRLRATLRRGGMRVWSSPVGVGKAGTRTPPGRFWIRERLRAGGGIYGPWAFGTSAYSHLTDWPGGGVVGIHGTDQPWLIPGRPSHGCVRVPNPAVRRLARLMPVGTPVRIV
jgi:L,D-transpeptidase-like protein